MKVFCFIIIFIFLGRIALQVETKHWYKNSPTPIPFFLILESNGQELWDFMGFFFTFFFFFLVLFNFFFFCWYIMMLFGSTSLLASLWRPLESLLFYSMVVFLLMILKRTCGCISQLDKKTSFHYFTRYFVYHMYTFLGLFSLQPHHFFEICQVIS